ncbi:MAG: dipeptidase [Chthoniobacterales bacterium]|nr:dipeptidase [Chthoniobacterales bacterium]
MMDLVGMGDSLEPLEPLETLSQFLRFPSISTQPKHAPDLQACAEWLSEKLTAIGLTATVHPTPGSPVVVAATPRDSQKRTVLIYGHYDVQPPDPLEGWTTPPFEPRIEEGRIYARGAADNKGQILAHILGVAETLREKGTLPVNVIFLIEGEEEIGSPSLADFLLEHREELACDLVAISDTGMAPGNKPALTYALRGIAAMELIVRGPARDLHSGLFGGAVANPATVVARLLASLHDDQGRVRIPGFYDAVRPLEPWEREAAASLEKVSGGDDAIKELAGVAELFGEKNFTTIERIGARPTAEVNGIGGGYQGAGTKTVLPKEAFAKITFRLVANQDPAVILAAAEEYLRNQTPPGVLLEIITGHSGAAYQSDPNSPDGLAARKALAGAFGSEPLLLRDGGSIPILATLKQILGVDSYLLGLANPDSRIHSPDENMLVENFLGGIRMNRILIQELA